MMRPSRFDDATAAVVVASPGFSPLKSIPRPVPDVTPADPADRILEPLDAAVGFTSVVELLEPVYDALCCESVIESQ